MLSLLGENEQSSGLGDPEAEAEFAQRALEIRRLVRGHNAWEDARTRARQLIDQAKDALQCLPDSPSRDLLASMADTVITRDR